MLTMDWGETLSSVGATLKLHLLYFFPVDVQKTQIKSSLLRLKSFSLENEWKISPHPTWWLQNSPKSKYTVYNSIFNAFVFSDQQKAGNIVMWSTIYKWIMNNLLTYQSLNQSLVYSAPHSQQKSPHDTKQKVLINEPTQEENCLQQEETSSRTDWRRLQKAQLTIEIKY